MLIFVPVGLSLICGYLAILLVQSLGMLAVTRLGPRYLMIDDRLTGTYFFCLAFVWFLSSVASGFVTFYFAPLEPYGPHVFCALLAVASAFIVFRNDRDLPNHQPVSFTLTLFAVIAAGYVAGDLLNLHT